MTNSLTRGRYVADRVAANVRAELARHRITQAAAAERTGITQSSLSRRLTCEQPFDIAELAELADLMGINLVDLVDVVDGAA
jgi:transcriptional regulator with XRE-family HTH domain